MTLVNNHPLISVIVPVYNEAEHIKRCLESLVEQTYPAMEILVVDDGSTDDTVRIIRAFQDNKAGRIDLKLYLQDHHGPGQARNYAASKATGTILAFVDADMELDPEYLAQLIIPIDAGEIGSFGGKEIVANQGNYWADAWSVVRGFAPGTLHPQVQNPTQPVFRAITKEAFDSVGGFDTTRGYDDDWTLCEKLGKEAVIASKAVIYHYNPASIGEFFEQSRWFATRRYKGGKLGSVAHLFRLWVAIFPLSIWKYLTGKGYLLARIVFILGQTLGILELWLSKKTWRS